MQISGKKKGKGLILEYRRGNRQMDCPIGWFHFTVRFMKRTIGILREGIGCSWYSWHSIFQYFRAGYDNAYKLVPFYYCGTLKMYEIYLNRFTSPPSSIELQMQTIKSQSMSTWELLPRGTPYRSLCLFKMFPDAFYLTQFMARQQ